MKRLMFLVSLLLVAGLGCIPSLAPPVIVALEASPPEIPAGESATLLWNVTGATSVTIDQGIGLVGAAGTRVVSPSTTTVYTLTATNTAGTVSKSVVVNVTVVAPPPPSPPPAPPPGTPPVIVAFSATPLEITVGDSTTLMWNVTGATSVSINPGIGDVDAAGTISVLPATTTVYTLTATNDAGSTSESLTVMVLAAPPTPVFAVTSVTASVSPSSFTGECPKTFNFSAVIAVNGPGTVTYRWERSDGAIASTQTVTFTAAGSKTVTATWTLSAAGTHWMRIHILTPNEMISNQASFQLICIT